MSKSALEQVSHVISWAFESRGLETTADQENLAGQVQWLNKVKWSVDDDLIGDRIPVIREICLTTTMDSRTWFRTGMMPSAFTRNTLRREVCLTFANSMTRMSVVILVSLCAWPLAD